MSAESVAFF